MIEEIVRKYVPRLGWGTVEEVLEIFKKGHVHGPFVDDDGNERHQIVKVINPQGELHICQFTLLPGEKYLQGWKGIWKYDLTAKGSSPELAAAYIILLKDLIMPRYRKRREVDKTICAVCNKPLVDEQSLFMRRVLQKAQEREPSLWE